MGSLLQQLIQDAWQNAAFERIRWIAWAGLGAGHDQRHYLTSMARKFGIAR
ncbi:hypothetical protein ACNKHN_07565 [Shigella flexneri]